MTASVKDKDGCNISENLVFIPFDTANILNLTSSIGKVYKNNKDYTVTICAPNTSVKLTPIMNTKNAPFTYSWDGKASSTTADFTISYLSTTNNKHNLVITNKSGCKDTINVLLVKESLPIISISGDTSICKRGFTTLTATSNDLGTKLVWNSTSTNPITVSKTGLNTVTATSSNGCIDKKSVNVVFKSVSFKLSKKDICPKDTFTVNIGLNNIKVMYFPFNESFANRFVSNTYANKQIVSTVRIPKYFSQSVEVINRVTNLLMKDSVVISYNVTDESGCQVDTIFTVKPYKIGLNLISSTPYYDSSDVRVYVPCKSSDDVTINPQGITNVKLGTPYGKYYTWKKDNIVITPSVSPALIKSKDKLALRQIYTCNFNDLVCSTSKSCMIRVVPDYKVAILGDTLLCKNSSNTLTCVIKDLKNVTINSNSSDTSIFTYAWYNSTNKVVSRIGILNATTPGIYTLKVKRFNGCEQILTYKVKLKQVGFKITQNQSLCKNQLFCINIEKNGLVTRVDKASNNGPWVDPWQIDEYYNTSNVTSYPIDPDNFDDIYPGSFRGTLPWEINSICSIMRDSMEIRYTMTDVQNCKIDTTFKFKSSLKLDVTSLPNLLGIRTGLYGDTVTFKTCSPITKLNLIGKNGKTAYTYNWYMNNTPTVKTNSSIISSPKTVPLFYYATVIDANKCKDTLKIKIIKPGVTVDVLGDTTTCSSTLITFKTKVINGNISDTTKFIYVLKNTSSGQNVNLPDSKSVSLIPGNYKLVVKGGVLICGDSIIKLFTIYPKNIKLTLSPITDNLQDICYGGNLNYTIKSSEPIEDKDLKIDYSYSISCTAITEKESSVFDNFSPSIKRSPSTVHNLSLKNIRLGNNCYCNNIATINITNSCSTDKISIVFSQKNAKILPIPKNQFVSCQKDSVQLTISTCGQIPKIYQWQDSLTNKVLSNNKVFFARPGVYKYSVVNECGVVEDSNYVSVKQMPLDIITLDKQGTINKFDNSTIPRTKACDGNFDNISIKICSNVDLITKNLKVEATPCGGGGDYSPVYWNYTLDENGCLILNFNPNKRYGCAKKYRIYGECTNVIYFVVEKSSNPGITINSTCTIDNIKHLTATTTSNYSSLKWIGYSSNEIDVPINSTKTYTVELTDLFGCKVQSSYDVICDPRPSSGLRNYRLINKISTTLHGDININSIGFSNVSNYFNYYRNESGKILKYIDGQVDLSFFEIGKGYLNPNTSLKFFYKNINSTDCSLIPDGVYLVTEILPTGEVRDLNYYDGVSSATPELNRCKTIVEIKCGNIIYSSGSCNYEFKEPITKPNTEPIEINIFPNPSNGDFEIVTNHEAIKNYKIIIYDLAGKEIYTKNMIDQTSGFVATQINLSNNKLANGLYSVKIYINDEVINQKIQINN